MSGIYEEFNDSQKKILEKYVSSVSGNIFVLKNLPEVIKGALFSRYSRSVLGLKALLLKEFILNEDTAFEKITAEANEADAQITAVQRAQNFYDRILDGYGDDSIGELGGAHLALENISMLAAKHIEDNRIGGSPLEKSTRYIYFDQKVKGEYLFYKEPILMTSAYRDLYLETCNSLFDSYAQMIPLLTTFIEQKFPKEHYVSQTAYSSALRAKVLDCLRGLLPAGTLTNMGLFGNGRFYEYMLQKLNTQNLTELQEIGKDAFLELSKIIPSFIRRADTTNKHYQNYAAFVEQTKEDLKVLGQEHDSKIASQKILGVNLVHFDPRSIYKVAAALLFENTNSDLASLETYCERLTQEELFTILDSACVSRENRRHKSPRALELAEFTFEIVADFGIYRDLQRHRILTQERQLLTCNFGYFIPNEILKTELEQPYREMMKKAKETYDAIAKEFPEEAQYCVPMAYNMRWFFHVNMRSLQWLCELRSSPAGHPNYRFVAQEMASQVSHAVPMFERFFKFVDFDGYGLGRMDQEIRKEEKKDNQQEMSDNDKK